MLQKGDFVKLKSLEELLSMDSQSANSKDIEEYGVYEIGTIEIDGEGGFCIPQDMYEEISSDGCFIIEEPVYIDGCSPRYKTNTGFYVIESILDFSEDEFILEGVLT